MTLCVLVKKQKSSADQEKKAGPARDDRALSTVIEEIEPRNIDSFNCRSNISLQLLYLYLQLLTLHLDHITRYHDLLYAV